MKRMKRIAAVIMAIAIICAAALTGCQQKLVPADQTVAALYELMVKNDAKPAVELMGFSSEEEARDALMEDGNVELADMFKEEFEALGVEFTDEELQEMSKALTSLVGKMTCTTEIVEESRDEVTVLLKMKGFNNADMEAIMTEQQEKAIENMDEETQAAIQEAVLSGDEAALMDFMKQILKDCMASIAQLEPAEGEREVTVKCERLTVKVGGKDKVFWLPADMDKFTDDVDNASFQ